MKTNETPEKIYISNFDIEALPKNEQLSERWHEVSTQDTDIEYTRTDAFIEKVYTWLKNYAFVDDNKSVNLPILLHDFLKDSRKF
jgi:hypothetical protein